MVLDLPAEAMEAVAGIQRHIDELAGQAADVDPVVEAMIKQAVEFEIRRERFKIALTK